METRRLQQFVTTVDAGTMTRAAQQLRVAQPALSQSIAILERDFGQSLLVRSHRGVEPTESGWALYRYARDMLRLEELARRQVQQGYENPEETVALGVAPYSAAPTFIVPLIAEVKRRYPRITLRIVEALSVVHSEAVRIGQLDVALIYHPGPVRGVRLETVSQDHLCMVTFADTGPIGVPTVGGDASDLRQSEPVSLTDLAAQDLILPRATHTLRALVERAFRTIDASPRIVLEIEHTAPLPEAVEAGIGVAVLPMHVAHAVFDSERFSIRPIEQPAVQARFALATSTESVPSHGTELVRDLLRAHVQRVEPESHGAP